MVNCHISPDRKYCALNLWNRGWDTIDICDALSVSRASLYRWQAIFQEHGNVIWPKSPLIGRTRILVRAILTAIHTLYEQESDLYLDELVTFLAIEHSIIISLSTLSRNLIEAGLTCKLLHKLASEHDEILREEWKQSIHEDFAGMDWSLYLWMRRARTSMYMRVVMAEQCLGATLCCEMSLFKVIGTH